MTMEAADGTTSMVALRFCTVSLTVIFKPFQSEVALAISSPIFLGDCAAIKQKVDDGQNIRVRRTPTDELESITEG
jgi:hypothetical protein